MMAGAGASRLARQRLALNSDEGTTSGLKIREGATTD
jgi:hypothetical protein